METQEIDFAILKGNYIRSMKSLLSSLEENKISEEDIAELGDIYRQLLKLQQSAVYGKEN